MDGKFDPWSTDNKMLGKVYQQDNFEYVDTGVESEWCYILFSSNGLYYPDTQEVFEEQIVRKNRFEWKWVVRNSKIPQRAARIIYVRDIHKIWYTYGISAKVDTIDKTLELLKCLTEKYKVVTVGSSAGGYMAVLTAIKLQAQYCLNFSGQYRIDEELKNPYTDISGMLDEYWGTVFYFAPAYCQSDIEQYRLVEKKDCVRLFLFRDDRHASTMLTGNIPYIIGDTRDELEKIYAHWENKKINKFSFLMHTVPFMRLGKVMYREVKGFFIRRSGKHWNGV